MDPLFWHQRLADCSCPFHKPAPGEVAPVQEPEPLVEQNPPDKEPPEEGG